MSNEKKIEEAYSNNLCVLANAVEAGLHIIEGASGNSSSTTLAGQIVGPDQIRSILLARIGAKLSPITGA